MFGLKKKNISVDVKSLEDETIIDRSKFVIFGFGLLIVSILLFFFLEIFTSLKISNQNSLLKKDSSVEEKSISILNQIGKSNYDVSTLEYKYLKEIMKFMSPKEFQTFKNNISGIASQLNVQINSINELKSRRLDIYHIYSIEYQFLSKYENLVKLKEKISETDFKVNVYEENIKRYSPESEKVLTSGIIEVYVFEQKEKIIKNKSKLIEKFKAIEEKELEKTKTEN
jgi:hypothetical protein